MSGLYPLGAEALGSEGTSSVQLDLSETLLASAVISASDIRESLSAGLTLTEAITGIDLPNLRDSVVLTGSAVDYFTARNGLTDGLTFEDSIQVALGLLLQENLQLAGAAAANKLLLGAIVDTLHAIGAAESRMDAVAAVSAAITIEALIANGYSVEAMDSVAFNEALQATAQFVGPLVDSAAMTDGVEHAMRIVALASDTLQGTDTLATAMQLNAEASDGILLYATIRLGGTEYAGWVLNTVNRAPSQYTNFPFDSFARFGDRYFAAGDGGIFELTGNTDDGARIDAFIRTGLSNFGTGKMKRVPDVYVAYTSTGDLVLKVVTTSATGEKVEDWYRMAAKNANAVREGRFQPGRGLKSVYWQFELCNTGGDDFDLAELKLRPLILDRRV